MALTTAQQVRLRIQDQPLRADDTYYGNGTADSFSLPHANLTSGTAYVPVGGTAWSATGCTFDQTGFVQFSSVIAADSAFRVVYVHSVFSEAEIGHYTAVGGSVAGAALEAVRALMFDGLKRARWMGSDGSQYDDTQAMRLLNDLHSALQTEVAQAQISQGGFQNWSLEQEGY